MAMRSASVAILMYHKVGTSAAVQADPFLHVTADHFSRQMSALARLGYLGITQDQAVSGLTGRSELPRRAVCVTFDDGYSCIHEIAAPILTQLDWPATVFVPSSHLGRSNAWDQELGHAQSPIMDSPMLRDLAGRGWEIAGHTRTHVHLDRLGDDEALDEIAGGAADLANAVGCPISTFCYPFGHLNDRTPDLVRRAGLVGASTTRSGIARAGHDPFRMPRVKVATRDGVAGMLYRLLIRPRLP